MKKLIYLPLIAFIVLTGCKGTSFTTQRYTNYKHTIKKGSIEERSVITMDKKDPVIEKEIIKEQHTTEVVVCAVSQNKSESTPLSGFPFYKAKTLIKRGFLNEYSENTSFKHEKNYNSKKTSSEVSETSKGPIEGVLGLVVSIIVLVIVIVLIIFLVTVLL